jgi:hypothetical protein
LLREQAYQEASLLLAYYGEDCLGSLAVMFQAIGADLSDRERRREQAVRIQHLEKWEDLRSRWPQKRADKQIGGVVKKQ